MTNPRLLATPFAENGVKNDIPESTAAEPQLATLNTGFPDITQTPISQGGVPPERADFNGILNLYGEHVVHLSKGLPYEFDSTFAQKIGGYPLHARVMLTNGDIVRNTMVNNINNPNSNMDGWRLGDSEISDANVILENGRTQREKNRDVVSALDFGLIPNSPIDQTSIVDGILNYSRTMRVSVQFPAGVVKISANKTKIFGKVGEANYREVKYAMDISGVDIVGVYKGYENIEGTVFDLGGSGICMLQENASTKNTTYSIRKFRAQNCDVALNMTYALMCRIEDFVYKDCENGIILGEPTIDAGALSNVFTNIYGRSTGAALQLIGAKWNNANQFHNCFFTGNKPSIINVSGGYGAISNTFYGGEFNTYNNTPEAGVIIGNAKNTTFYSTYFEPRGNAIILEGQAKKVMLVNCTFSVTRSDATIGSVPSFIHHQSGASSIVVVGGSVILGDDTGLQDNFSLISSSSPSVLQVDIENQPYVFLGGAKNWMVIRLDLISKLERFSGVLKERLPVLFSKDGGSISGISPSSSLIVSISGNIATVSVEIDITSDSVFGAGDYYIEVPVAPRERALGVAYYATQRRRVFGNCSLTKDNRNLFMFLPIVRSSVDEPEGSVSTEISSVYATSTSIAEFNTNGAKIFCQISYAI